MRRPGPDVRILAVQDRRSHGTANPWVSRWKVAGRAFSKAHPTRAAADSFTARLRVAAEDGQRFDPHTGYPEAWHDSGLTVADWALLWLRREWPDVEPCTRRGYGEALVRALEAAVVPTAPTAPEGLREALWDALRACTDPDVQLPPWLARWSLPLAELDRRACSALYTTLGTPAGTAGRFRKTTRAMLQAAVEAGHLSELPWPQPGRGVAQRKRAKQTAPGAPVDLATLPTPQQAR